MLARAATIIRDGGVVAYPTDTLYGLAADPCNQQAVEQLYRIKGRQVDRAVPLVAASREQIEGLSGALPACGRLLAEAFWPGPLTLIVPAWDGLARAVSGGLGTVAVRVPDHAVARALARACGRPVTSTSANRSGEPAPMSPEDVLRGRPLQPDLLLDAGNTPGGLPSTIVDVTGNEPCLVRAGAVPWKRVLECLQ